MSRPIGPPRLPDPRCQGSSATIRRALGKIRHMTIGIRAGFREKTASHTTSGNETRP